VRLVFLGLLVILSGCGFHLKGTQPGIKPKKGCTKIQIQQASSYSSFYRTFYSLSKQYGIVIIPPTVERKALSADTQIVHLGEPGWSERPLSYTSDGQTNYILIELILPYDIETPAGTVLSDKPIILARPMSVYTNAFLNNDSQREIVRQSLIQEACLQLLNKLSAQTAPFLPTVAIEQEVPQAPVAIP